jgi:hypothetical protein
VSESTVPASPAGGARHPDLLSVYVNDHLASSVGGIELVARMLGRWRGTDYEGPLEQLLDELRGEKSALEGQIRALGLPLRRYKQGLVWVAEKASRAKLNGRLLERSPLSDLVEFEFLASAVRGKRSGFETLRALAAVDPRVDAELFDGLIAQAHRQYQWLTGTRRDVAAQVFGGDPTAVEEAVGGGVEEA